MVNLTQIAARVAELFDGEQIGSAGLLNDDIFGVLALHHAGAPAQLLRRIVDYLRTKQLADAARSPTRRAAHRPPSGRPPRLCSA